MAPVPIEHQRIGLVFGISLGSLLCRITAWHSVDLVASRSQVAVLALGAPDPWRWGPGCRLVLKLPASPNTTKTNWFKDSMPDPSLTNQIPSLLILGLKEKSFASNYNFRFKTGSHVPSRTLRGREMSLQGDEANAQGKAERRRSGVGPEGWLYASSGVS